MTDIRTRLTDALADHMMVESSCLCGEDDFTFADDWGRHLVDKLLALPGIAIVDVAEVRRQIADDLNAKYRDGTVTEADEFAAGKMYRLLSAADGSGVSG